MPQRVGGDEWAADAALASQIAAEAGTLLLDMRRNHKGGDEEALGRAADARAHDLILNRLASARPEDAIVSEEAADDPGHHAEARRVWFVDPLDGTREYGEGCPDWAVHVGLTVDGVAWAGAVALPALGEIYDTASVRTRRQAPRDCPRILLSRSRGCAAAEALAAKFSGTLLPMGSAGAKAMAVVRGDAEAYVHSSGLFAWDSCAPVAVAQAAGLWVGHLDGTPLRYSRTALLMGDLMIATPAWGEALSAAWVKAGGRADG